jgi:hypothetical protein
MGEKQEQEHHAIHGIVESCQKLADKGGSITMINRQLCGGGGGCCLSTRSQYLSWPIMSGTVTENTASADQEVSSSYFTCNQNG